MPLTLSKHFEKLGIDGSLPTDSGPLLDDIYRYLSGVSHSTILWLAYRYRVRARALSFLMRRDPRFRHVPPKKWVAVRPGKR